MFENYDDILTIEELADALKIGTTQAYKLVPGGKLGAFKDGKDWKIPKFTLEMYIMERSR